MFFVKTHLFRHVKLIFFIFSGKFGVFSMNVFSSEPLPAAGLRIRGPHNQNRVSIETVTNRQIREFYDIWSNDRVPTRTGKLGKMGRHFPVREKSGNFEQTGKVREKSGKITQNTGKLKEFEINII